jgi:hypothetical protein
VDDKPPRSGLLSRSAHPSTGELLDSLLAQGFIEVDPDAVASAGGPPPAPFSVASVLAGAPSEQEQVEVSLASASRFARRVLTTHLGPSADDLTAQIEKTTGATELLLVLEKCRQIIQGMAGKQKADDFWEGISARLPKA